MIVADRALDVVPATVTVDRSLATSLYKQLYDGLRDAIISGRLAPGVRLPSTRSLARDLGIARNTVLAVYEQLYAEGYVQGRTGAGTYVASVLPDGLDHGTGAVCTLPQGPGAVRVLSNEGLALQNL